MTEPLEFQDTDESVWEPKQPVVPSTWLLADFRDAFAPVSVNQRKVPAGAYKASGALPVVDQGQAFIGGYTDDDSVAIDPGEGLIVFGDHTRVFKRVPFRFAAGADGIKVLRPLLCDSAYAYYACKSLQFPNRGYSRHYSFLTRCKIPISPEPEQKRIVSKIDELFSRIDEGERALERISKLVERYRQSVLKAAVTGELTRAWREKNKDTPESGEALLARILTARRSAWEKAELSRLKAKGTTPASDSWKKKYQEPVRPQTSGLPSLPDGWAWASVDQLCAEFGNGLSKKPANEPPGEPILRISAVRSLAVDSSDTRYYVPDDREQLDSFYARRGDLLFTRYNGSRELVGVSGVVNSVERVLHPDKLIKARPAAPDLLGSDYLAIAVNCGASWRHISSCVKTSAGQHGISGSDIKRTPVPVPPTEEQRQIVDAFALADGKCAETRISCAREMRRSGAARQSILAAAFAGELVSQDPADEPAALLLERIAAESGANTITPKRGRKKTPA